MNCVSCGRDIDQIGQDNVSPIVGYPVCEDCKKDGYLDILLADMQGTDMEN